MGLWGDGGGSLLRCVRFQVCWGGLFVRFRAGVWTHDSSEEVVERCSGRMLETYRSYGGC